ncbi:MAG: energy transducer TonB [Bacteroidales bacterium]|jgi:protein TonB|nr:energy transducer TonB [Bacteroidales bacterium]NLM92478.1 energy transducer TonB [Bacteroidales bacterium]
MEAKKSPKADLENKKRIFLQIGLAIALLGVLAAFEWKTYERQVYDLGTLEMDFIEEEDIPITRQETPPPPPPPEASTELVIVDDDVEIEDEFMVDVEATVMTEVKEFTPVVVVQEEEEISEEVIFTVVEDQPSYPGGEEARIRYLQENLRYPQMAREAGIQGTVFVTFVVERDGSVTDVRVLRGIGGGCDEEAVRVVQNMPRWNPGRQRGQPVRVQFNMPIRFVLN